MKKILFALIALVCSMSMNAQVMIVMRGNTVVATYTAAQADNVVFKNALASVEFKMDRLENDFTSVDAKTKTASNDDVTITLALNTGEWDRRGTGQFMMATSMTATVTPKASGVTVTGIRITDLRDHASMTKTGAGPWNFTLDESDWYAISDGVTTIHGIASVTVEYTK